MKTSLSSLAGLDLLASAVVILDTEGRIIYANPAAEHLFESSSKALSTHKLTEIFLNGEDLVAVFKQAVEHQFADKRQDLTLERAGREPLQVHTIVTALDNPEAPVLIEFRENVQQLKLDREERLIDQSQANKELIRNLAHEIKNP
ncbi:MAG: PAS domain-containing protein, partial [Burkholderiaceae bacterium]